MGFLSLNGCDVGVIEASHLAPILIGARSRAFSGKLIDTVRARKEGFHFRSQAVTQQEAQAIRGLVEGRGHSFSFNSDLYSDGKGLGPFSGYGAALITTAPKWGAKCLSVSTNIAWDTQLAPFWTLATWRKETAGAWVHHVFTSDLRHWKNGAVSQEAMPWARVDAFGQLTLYSGRTYDGGFFYPSSTGTAVVGDIYRVTMSGGRGDCFWQLFSVVDAGALGDVQAALATAPIALGSTFASVYTGAGGPSTYTWLCLGALPTYYITTGAEVYDDALAVPYAVPSAWGPTLYSDAAARAWTPLPQLRVTGDVVAQVGASALTVQGTVADSPVIQATLSAAWQDNAESVEFALEEV